MVAVLLLIVKSPVLKQMLMLVEILGLIVLEILGLMVLEILGLMVLEIVGLMLAVMEENLA